MQVSQHKGKRHVCYVAVQRLWYKEGAYINVYKNILEP